MSNRGQFRPIPLTTADRLPGDRSASRRFSVICGPNKVRLWASSERTVGWVFSPDEARRLGMELMAQADAAEGADEPDRKGA